MENITYIPIMGHPSAGKSTLIRLLVDKKAKVGKKAGTTKTIKDYQITEYLTIRDYPGFGKVATRSRSYADNLQNRIIRNIESIAKSILVPIIVTDLSTFFLMYEKFSQKGIIPLDFEMADFLFEITGVRPIVLGNKIDKLNKNENLDLFAEYFPKNVDFFPISLKSKKNIKPFMVHLETLCFNRFQEEDINYFYDLRI